MASSEGDLDKPTTAISSRVASVRLSAQERYLHYLDIARQIREDNGLEQGKIDAAIKQGQDELVSLAAAAGGKIEPRRRPINAVTRDFTLFIDECGSHTLNPKERFAAFCLSGVLVADTDMASVDHRWKRWKRHYLGSATKRVHEPDIRQGSRSFWCEGNAVKRERAVARLDNILGSLAFTGFVCVVRRDSYRALVGDGPLDASLPQHVYLMAIDFLMERVALALDLPLGGGKARVVVESRGPREDAAFQYEFARLFLNGTSYVSATCFRSQFFPGIDFKGKGDNSTGLQLADLLARPCGEKIIGPATTPPRWVSLRGKLCPRIETAHSILGLKIVPWDDSYQGVWEKS